MVKKKIKKEAELVDFDGKHWHFQIEANQIPEIEVYECILKGKIKGSKDKIDLVMDKKRFHEWIKKLRTKEVQKR